MTSVNRKLHIEAIPGRGRPAPHIPPRRTPARRITSDAEAIVVAQALAADFAREAADRDREHSEQIDRPEPRGRSIGLQRGHNTGGDRGREQDLHDREHDLARSRALSRCPRGSRSLAEQRNPDSRHR